MIYSLLKEKLIYNNHLIINFLKGRFGTGIHNNREIWLFQGGHFCYPFCTVEEMKPTEPRWGWMWHNHFEVLFVFTGWPTSHQKESPSPNWSSSKVWEGKRIQRIRIPSPTESALKHTSCTRGITSSASREGRVKKYKELLSNPLKQSAHQMEKELVGALYSACLCNNLQLFQVAAVFWLLWFQTQADPISLRCLRLT